MKQLILFVFFIATSVHALDQSPVQVIAVSDRNNELVSGAKVELIGTGKVYYTNSKGECYIPLTIYKQCKSVKVECISYKPVQFNISDISSKVILEFR